MREHRYEVDARMTPTSHAVFQAFESPGMRRAAFRLARALLTQGFRVRIQQASPYSGPGNWHRVVYEGRAL